MKRWIAALVFGVGSASAAPPIHPPPGQVQPAALPVVEAELDKTQETKGPILTQDQFDEEEGQNGGPCAPSNVEVSATSTHPPEGKARYDVGNLVDRKLKTAWVEGVPGPGTGEAVTFRLKRSYKSVDEVSKGTGDSDRTVFGSTFIVVNGYASSPETWKKNLRVKSLKMFFNGKPVALVHLQDSPAAQRFSVEPHVNTDRMKMGDTFRFEIVEVYREGAKYEDTAISELSPTCSEIN